MGKCGCSKGKCCVLAMIAGFIFVFAFDFLVHGMFLKEAYADTADLWRPEGEYKMPFMLASQLLFVITMTFLFSRNNEGKGLKEGLRFGAFVGLVLASLPLASYSYMPISFCLTACWMGAAFVKSVGTGAVISFFCKTKA